MLRQKEGRGGSTRADAEAEEGENPGSDAITARRWPGLLQICLTLCSAAVTSPGPSPRQSPVSPQNECLHASMPPSSILHASTPPCCCHETPHLHLPGPMKDAEKLFIFSLLRVLAFSTLLACCYILRCTCTCQPSGLHPDGLRLA
jgi:hypothetical protein